MGKALKGVASPHYKTGERSKYMPTRLLSRVEAALGDPGLLDLRRDVALVETRLAGLLAQLDTDDGSAWSAVYDCYLALRGAMQGGNKKEIASVLTELDSLITRGADEVKVWEQIGAVLEQRRRLVESESRIVTQAQQTLTIAQAMMLADALLKSVHKNVSDRVQLIAIQEDFVRFAGVSGQVLSLAQQSND